MKENKSKWYYIVHNFLDSGREVLKLYEPNSPENAVICLKHYLVGKGFPIIYAKRENYIYLIRTDCLAVPVEDAMYGIYIEKEKIS